MKHFLASLGVVLRKELIDGLRDRRSILSAVVPLAIIPLLILFSFDALSDEIEQARRIKVPVAGAEHAQALIDWLDQQWGVEIEAGISQPLFTVREGEQDFVLVVPEDFGKSFEEGRSAELEIVVDSSDTGARLAVGSLRTLIRAYAAQVSDHRLIARGVSPELIRPVTVETIELQSSQERAAVSFMFIPILLLVTAFIGGQQIAIDSTAGERERLSLEPLLLNPVPRLSIIGGKWLAALSFAGASLVMTTGMLMLVLDLSPMRRVGIDLDIGLAEFGSMLATVLPLAMFGSALLLSVSTLARSYKEAQTYSSFLVLAPMLPMMLSVGSPIEPVPWKLLVPLLGQHILLTDILEGKNPEPLSLAIASAAAVAVAIGFLTVTAHQFRRERIVFGRTS